MFTAISFVALLEQLSSKFLSLMRFRAAAVAPQ